MTKPCRCYCTDIEHKHVFKIHLWKWIYQVLRMIFLGKRKHIKFITRYIEPVGLDDLKELLIEMKRNRKSDKTEFKIPDFRGYFYRSSDNSSIDH